MPLFPTHLQSAVFWNAVDMTGMKKIVSYVVAALVVALLILAPDYTTRVQSGSHMLKSIAVDTLRCGILAKDALATRGHRLGLLYEIFRKFEKDNSCHISVELFSSEEDVVNSLVYGLKDMAIVQYGVNVDSLAVLTGDGVEPVESPYLFSSIGMSEQDYRVVCRAEDYSYLAKFSSWFRLYRNTADYEKLMRRFRHNPPASTGPYDDMIRTAAVKLNWDWRLLSALIYKESHFKIGLSSSKGAIGLMQIKQYIADMYGIKDIYDPQQNIEAGTMYLKDLQDKFRRMDCDSLNSVLFAIASYNCGDARIADGMKIAEQKGIDHRQWNNVRTVLPLMEDSTFCKSFQDVRTKVFRGQRTVDYVDDVLELFEDYKDRF